MRETSNRRPNVPLMKFICLGGCGTAVYIGKKAGGNPKPDVAIHYMIIFCMGPAGWNEELTTFQASTESNFSSSSGTNLSTPLEELPTTCPIDLVPRVQCKVVGLHNLRGRLEFLSRSIEELLDFLSRSIEEQLDFLSRSIGVFIDSLRGTANWTFYRHP